MKKLHEKITNVLIKAQIAKANVAEVAMTKVKGAVAFEYIIILVIMAAIIFAAFDVLKPIVLNKINDVANQINTRAY